MYLETTNIATGNGGGIAGLAMNNQTVHHGDSYDEEYDEEYDDEVPNKNRRIKNDEHMLMGMGLLGVVATQHIREEYDDEDNED